LEAVVKDVDDNGGARGTDQPLGATVDVDQWAAQAPPDDFADRVLTRIRAEEQAGKEAERPSRTRTRRWAAMTGGAAALALAAAMLLRVSAPPSAGEAIATDRVTVPIGARALAVLEPGANVRWNGDDVVQSEGDVFYRVEPGKRFTVHTPAGDVEVKGTCFTVKVRPLGESQSKTEVMDMQKRDVKSGAAGAALSALAFVAVYEGKVAVSHASDRVDLQAGETAQTGPNGVRLTGATADGSRQFDQNVATAQAENDPTAKANQSLVHQVGEYRSRLEAVAKQKAELEEKLQKSEANLAAAQDGGPLAIKSAFDLSKDDWKELAKDGTIKYQQPCVFSKNESYTPPSPESLSTLGLAPQDGATIRDANARVGKEVWDELKPICARAVGSDSLAEKIGANTCVHLVLDIEYERDREASARAQREVGEIRAGLRPIPAPNAAVHPLTKMFMTMTGANKRFEDELAQSFGPEEAHRIAYSGELCVGQHTFGGSAQKK
jgi:hypothetical protein